ncbi:MAG: glycosyltransferase family 9 protein [Candidatus Omnitrophica bacterium]|nr:glycosyltransferase family 9 protein [Candidatus Omnitrophota bacterium]
MKIATFAPKEIGDTIMATPMFKALRNLYPDAVIDIVTEIENHPVIEGIGLFDHIITFWEGIDLSGYDLALMPVFSCEPAVHSAAKKAKQFIGIEVLYSLKPHSLIKRLTAAHAHMLFEKHQVELNMELVRKLGYNGEIPEMYCPVLEEDIFSEYKDKIACCIYTPQNSFQAGKNRFWPLERWKALIDLLGEENVLLVGATTDTPNIKKLSEAVKCKIKITSTIREFVRLCKQLKVLITTDHGAMHIAATSGVPIVSLHGASSPVLLHPWVAKKGKSISIISSKLCSPCQRSYRLRFCERALTTQNCMEKITPKQVASAIDMMDKLEIGESRILIGYKLMTIEEFRHNWWIKLKHLINITVSREMLRIAKLVNPSF